MHPDFFFRDSLYRILPHWEEKEETVFIKVHTLKKGETTIYLCDKTKVSLLMRMWLWLNGITHKDPIAITFSANVRVGD